MRHFRPQRETIAAIYKVGVPSIIMQAISSVMTFGMNKILLMFSSTAAAVFGVYFKLQSFVFMPVFGLNNGMIPIIAYNYGAQNKKRITRTIKLSIIIAVSIMIVGLIVFQVAPGFLLRNLFDASDRMLEIGIPALRIISELCFCRLLDCGKFRISSSGKWSIQPDCIRCQTTICYPAPGLYLLHYFWASYDMVGNPHCRNCIAYSLYGASFSDLPVKD